jgi:hypothetical protein
MIAGWHSGPHRLWLSARKWLQQADFFMVAGFAEQFPLDTTYGK